MIKTKKQNIITVNGVTLLTFPALSERDDLVCAFSTRLGGISKGCFADMNLSFTTGDKQETVRENYRIISQALGIDEGSLVLSAQTHTNNIRIVTADDRGKGVWRERDYTDVDALITAERGVTLVTHSADCCLLAFFDPVRQVIASAHAGWRGTVAEIGKKTVQKMVGEFGCNPQDILVGIAPSVGRCCYEVDDPVFSAFKKLSYLDLDKLFFAKKNGKYMLDLWQANLQILTNSGIKQENVFITDVCTNCQAEYFHSHRATGGKRGVNALLMQLR